MTRKFYDNGILIIVLLPLLILAGCSNDEGANNANTEKVISVKGEEIAQVSRDLRKAFTGTLEGERQAVIRAKISEAVDRIEMAEGDEVKANAVIVWLDKTGPSSNYIQSKSVYQNAEKNFKKMEFLFSEGAISETQFDGARTEYEVARANFEAARQLVELSTPIAGTVTSIDVSPGDYVSPGQQVATVAEIARLRMKLGVSASDIGYFDIGDTVRVVVGSVSGVNAYGKVVTVARSADPTTRTFQVEIELNNASHSFTPGLFARADVIIEKFDNIIAVPRPAVISRNNQDYVFTISGDRVKARQVTRGAEFNGSVQIKSGLNVGDTVVTVGQDYLDDGYKIKLARFVNAAGEEIEP